MNIGLGILIVIIGLFLVLIAENLAFDVAGLLVTLVGVSLCVYGIVQSLRARRSPQDSDVVGLEISHKELYGCLFGHNPALQYSIRAGLGLFAIASAVAFLSRTEVNLGNGASLGIMVGSIVVMECIPSIWKSVRIFFASRNPFASTSKHVKRIIQEISRYNHIVKELVRKIHTLDQLAEIGHSVTLQNREEILKAFRGMRAELTRALQTERILRKAGTIPEDFSINLLPFNAIEPTQQIKDMERLLNEASDIALRVQNEMRELNGP